MLSFVNASLSSTHGGWAGFGVPGLLWLLSEDSPNEAGIVLSEDSPNEAGII